MVLHVTPPSNHNSATTNNKPERKKKSESKFEGTNSGQTDKTLLAGNQNPTSLTSHCDISELTRT